MTQTRQHKTGTRPRARNRVPHFKTVREEAEFWDRHSTTEFENDFEPVTNVRFVVTRESPKKAVGVRLDAETVAELAEHAQASGVAPSTLARIWIVDRLRSEARKRRLG